MAAMQKKMSELGEGFKLADDPEYKAMRDEVAAMRKADLQRKASEIAAKTIKGADGKGQYKLSEPARKIVREILLSEKPSEIKLSEKDGDNVKEVTVTLADTLERLVDNLALVKMGESTKSEHGNEYEDPEKKLSALVTKKLSENKDLDYRGAFDAVMEENPELAQAVA